MTRRIVLVYNTSKYLYRFRRKLIEELGEADFEVIAAVPIDEYTEKLKSLGVDIEPIRVRSHSFNPFHDYRTYKDLKNCFRRRKPDMVFCFTIKPVIYGSIAAHRCRIRNIHSMIPGLGSLFSRRNLVTVAVRKFAMNLYRMALRHNRCVFFQNEESRSLFLEAGLVNDNQSFLIPGSGVDTAYYRHEQDCGNSRDVLMACRMLHQKGVEEFITAAEQVAPRFPGVRFVLAGSVETSPDAIPAKELDRFRDSGQNVHYVGEVFDLRPLIDGARCAVLPTYYGEGVPRFLLESMSMSRPIVTTNVPGCRELVCEHENGFLVPPRDAQRLVDAIVALIDDPEKASRMGRVSRKLVKERFQEKDLTRRMLDAVLERSGYEPA